MRHALFAACALCLALFWAQAPAQAKRVALVIGNDTYANVDKLQKARNDARVIGDTLASIGFEVSRASDLDRRGLNRTLQGFAAAVAPGDEVFMFFAGHGVEIRGRNYLLPTDIPDAGPGNENFVRGEAIAVDSVLDAIRERAPRISILVLDACRNNPFKRSGTRSLGGARGFARIAAPKGTFIMYSAGVGQSALDRLGDDDANPNSIFTRTLVPLLKEPGLKLTDAARRLRRQVEKLALSVSHDQRPAYYDEVTGDYHFVPGRAAAPTAAAPALDQDDMLWSNIANSSTAADFEFYLRLFPDGKYAAVAKLKLEQLDETKVAVGVFPKPRAEDGAKAASRCDTLAADPDDRQAKKAGAGKGVAIESIETDEAVRACQAAVEAGSGEPRHHYQLGRSLYRAIRFDEAIAALETAARLGHTAAMRLLADFHASPKAGLARDDQKAFEWQLMAAEAGDPGAMTELIEIYWQGRGMEKNRSKARTWYERAHAAYQKLADAGDLDAMQQKAALYEEGLGGPRDLDQALAWYLKAADRDHTGAMHSLYYNYYYAPYGYTEDKAQAAQWERRLFQVYRERAENGDGHAMDQVGDAYDDGDGVTENKAEAIRWYRRSEEAGYHYALASLAIAYQYGDGVTEDNYKADKYWRRYYDWSIRAAEAGDADAKYYAASAYEDGDGVTENDRKASRLLREAAELGHKSSMTSIAINYAYGSDGFTESARDAYRWYRRAAEADYWSSAWLAGKVAEALDSGKGVGRNANEAAEIMVRAFDQSGSIDNGEFKKLGSRSVQMRRHFQTILKSAGFYDGTIDGQPGSGTRGALEAYIGRVE